MSGFFITLEGPDGSGKTTVGNKIAEKLTAENIAYIKTREPGGSPISEKLREVILGIGNEAMDPRTEVLLIAAARRQHVVETIRPALAENLVVLCDRFLDSSLAYQAGGRNLDMDEVLAINHYAVEDTMPDRTYYLDVPAEVGLERIAANKGREINRLDQEDIVYHQRVGRAYAEVMNRFSERFKRIDAMQSPDAIADAIIADLLTCLGRK